MRFAAVGFNPWCALAPAVVFCAAARDDEDTSRLPGVRLLMLPTAPPPQPPRAAVVFILATTFLNFAGIGLIAPVTPFLVERYIAPDALALVNGLLFTAYSFFQFLAVPALGALSDRYGRRVILLTCLAGSAVGYFLFGVGGALWVLFLGRIIDGVTGGNVGVIYAYTADITDARERTRWFGLLGACAGVGFVLGPALGALLLRVFEDPRAPVYCAAVVTALNVVFGLFAMPESLAADRRAADIPLARLNPFSQLLGIFQYPYLRLFLVAIFFQVLPFAALQSNLSVLGKEYAGATPDQVSSIFALIGVINVVVQGGLLRPLSRRFRDEQLATAGVILQMASYALLGLVPLIGTYAVVAVGSAVFAAGNGLFNGPSSSLLSQAVSAREQGRVQGGNQSVQALARVLGPLYASAVYGLYAGLPYFAAVIMCAVSLAAIAAALPALRAAAAERTAVAPDATRP
jgi:DHA1 family tetracycline resistance protein-like MFS transporter